MEQQKYLNDIIDKAILYLKEVEKIRMIFQTCLIMTILQHY